MKFYCPKKWYRNDALSLPVYKDVDVQVMLQDGFVGNVGIRAAEYIWRYVNDATIVAFRVTKRTPQLVGNPSVQLSEVFKPRAG